MEYAIQSKESAESDYAERKINNRIMYVNIAYRSLKDGEELDLEH